MTAIGLSTYLALGALCVGAAFCALWLMTLFDRGRPSANPADRVDSTSLLFDDDNLVHATDAGHRLLSPLKRMDHADWADAHRALALRFPDLPATAAQALARAPATLLPNDPDDGGRLDLEDMRGKIRLVLDDPARATVADRHLATWQARELLAISRAGNLFPFPVWFCDAQGAITWANNCYHDLAHLVNSDTTGENHISAFDLGLPDGGNEVTERAVLNISGEDKPMWFNTTRIRTDDGGSLNFAIDIDAVVAAEIAQRKFVQTLTKTFAQLSIGLAIFDRNRQLALFNPALIDLTALPADFLSARPNLLTFFDKLRENRMMPEPKDYSNWRQHIADLVVASADGRYHETWTLPSGLTYRVTGRPHPDGAIALLFEDISAEVSLTRRFRAQLSLGQSVIDTLDEAIAVFSSSGVLTVSNAAYRKMWKMDPDSSFAEITIQDALRVWQSMARSNPLWTRLRDCVQNVRDRSEWFADLEMKSGAAVECRVTPVGGGATLVGFRLRPVLEAKRQPTEDTATQR
jgi:PAS domain-containing protein